MSEPDPAYDLAATIVAMFQDEGDQHAEDHAGNVQCVAGMVERFAAAQRAKAAGHDELLKAVDYALRRIQNDANVRWYCGPGTQLFYLLCQAEAAVTGETLANVEAQRSERYDTAHVAEIVQMRERYKDCQCGSNDED